MNQTISEWLKAAPGESDDGVFAPSDDQTVRMYVPPELLDHGGEPLARILLTNIELSIEAMEHGNTA